jgi:hypothetical protein
MVLVWRFATAADIVDGEQDTEMAGDDAVATADADTAAAAAGGAGGGSSGGSSGVDAPPLAVAAGTGSYFSLAHQRGELVTEQPAMMKGGDLKP